MPERPVCDVLDCKDCVLGRCKRQGGICKKRVLFEHAIEDAPVEPDEDEVDIE